MSDATHKSFSWSRFLTVAVWVALIAMVSVGFAKIMRLESGTATHIVRSEFAALSARVQNLNRRLTGLENAPASVTETQFSSTRDSLERRLSNLETLSTDVGTHGEISALQTRVAAVETRVTRPRMPVPAPLAAVPSPKPMVLDPPFTPLSIELRGGERVLSVLPMTAASVAQARVMHIGDREGGWTLERLEERTADFRIEGDAQVHHLTLP